MSVTDKIRNFPTPPANPKEILYNILEFTRLEAISGILLLLATVVALIWANSPYAGTVWETELTIRLGDHSLSESLRHWINDGLMALFFFVIGLEIKREILVGELASLKKTTLPLIAALGGMVLPALIYAAFNFGREGASGWGIPMATDIAFALGILALLGPRVPEGLKVFLLALAIVDDIGAVLVIALFYTAEIWWGGLAIGAVLLVALVLINRLGVLSPIPYALLGLGLWLTFLESGVQTTVAGVLVAMTIPARSGLHPDEFVDRGRDHLEKFERANKPEQRLLASPEQKEAVKYLKNVAKQVEPPLQRLERALHPWAIFLIMPLFALANAGVSLSLQSVSTLLHPVGLGIMAGLILGKSSGIMISTWLVVRSGLADLPTGVTWKQIYGAGWVAGLGFTMSLFIAGLAFSGQDQLLSVSKIAILTASAAAALGGWALLDWACCPPDTETKTKAADAEHTPTEAGG
jgi:NhaA family Na+:H+ antiporter